MSPLEMVQSGEAVTSEVLLQLHPQKAKIEMFYHIHSVVLVLARGRNEPLW